MGGTVVIIIVLVLFPVLVLMSSVVLAAILGWVFTKDREEAYEGTEYAALGGHGPKPDDEPDQPGLVVLPTATAGAGRPGPS